MENHVEKLKAQALKHKKVAGEFKHKFLQTSIYTFVNALKQIQLLNPEVQLRMVGAHPNYEVEQGRIMDGDEVVDLGDSELMDPLVDLEFIADYVDEGVNLFDVEEFVSVNPDQVELEPVNQVQGNSEGVDPGQV